MIYRLLLALTFLVIFIIIMFKNSRQKNLLQETIVLFKNYFHVIWIPFKSKGKNEKPSLNMLKEALLGMSGWLFVLMAFSGFLPVLIIGSPLTGLPLMVHVTLAPFFVLSLALTALFYAKSKQFNGKDVSVIQDSSDKTGLIERLNFLSKLSFWFLLVLSIPAILSIVLSMYPIFSLASLETMAHIHGYSVLSMFIVAFIYFLKKIETQLENER